MHMPQVRGMNWMRNAKKKREAIVESRLMAKTRVLQHKQASRVVWSDYNGRMRKAG